MDSDVLLQFVYDVFYDPILYTSASITAFCMIAVCVAIIVNSIPND